MPVTLSRRVGVPLGGAVDVGGLSSSRWFGG
jgi:hypothetical protein